MLYFLFRINKTVFTTVAIQRTHIYIKHLITAYNIPPQRDKFKLTQHSLTNYIVPEKTISFRQLQRHAL